jgi:hypothetical protein
LLGLAALLTISLQSHSAASTGGATAVRILLDWLHLVAMAAWLGGLLPLILLIRAGKGREGWAAVLVPCFSRVALPSVAALLLTGFASSLFLVQTIEALLATTHGRGLALKLGLFAMLVALGAVNLLWLSPLLRQNESAAVRRLGRSIRVEMVIGTAVLLIVGGMTAVAPAYEALEAQERLGFSEVAHLDDASLTLRVAPVHVGDNEFAVDVVDNRPGASAVESEVILRFRNEGQGISEFQVETNPVGEGRYLARGAYLSVSGIWQIEVILRRSGYDDYRHTFEVLVSETHDDHNLGDG